MPVIETHRLSSLDNHPEGEQIYNALDCCVTFEVWEALQTLFNQPPAIYTFERSLQGPALDMMLRGWRIDKLERDKNLLQLQTTKTRLEFTLNKYAEAVWGKSLNPRSNKQLLDFFYEQMKLPEIWTSIKGVKALRMNRESLERLEVYFYARPIIACILGIRDIDKKIQVLTQEVDPDGRMRTSINVGATETGRFSSSKSTTGTGGNFFNITEELRNSFIADEGYKLCGIDLEQAESREVGFICGRLFDDWSYLDACEEGDLHTKVTRMVWRDLGWTENSQKNREIADQLFYRNYSYRYMAKRGGHGTNYLLAPWTASRQLKCPVSLMEEFQLRYMEAFPGIPSWHRYVAEQLQTTQQLTTIFGRQRHFFGRPNDDATLREAVAYEPQSSTADRLNVGLLRIWNHFGDRIQILLQLYDAIYFQFRETENEQEIIREALELIDVPLFHKGRRFTVPGEAKVGWNWASWDPIKNPDGLKKFKLKDERKRTTFLDRLM